MGLGKGRKKSCLSVERCGWLNGVWQCVQTNPNGLKLDTAVGRFLLQAEEKSVIFTLLFKYIEVCEHVELEVSTSGVLVGCMLSRAVEVIGFSWTNEVYSQSQSCTHCTAINTWFTGHSSKWSWSPASSLWEPVHCIVLQY